MTTVRNAASAQRRYDLTVKIDSKTEISDTDLTKAQLLANLAEYAEAYLDRWQMNLVIRVTKPPRHRA